jgi:hypothetical protein
MRVRYLCFRSVALWLTVIALSCRCLKDTMLPLKYPVNTPKGPQNNIFVPKGTTITIGMNIGNRDKDTWGPDADQFEPDRWLDGRAASAEGSPGIYSHM